MRSSGALAKILGLFVLACAFGARVPSAAAHGGDGHHDDGGDQDRVGHGELEGRGDGSINVQTLSFDVTLSDAHVYRVAGYLYAPQHARHRTVQFLIHGATYNHLYWDVPEINHRRYSYAREMARRGYVVVSIDQLGAGNSDKPDGDFFSLEEAASTLHQIAGQVRAFGGRDAKLAYVGHSNGAVTSIFAQGTYGDADSLVSTGWVHGFRRLPVDPTDPDIMAAVSTPYINFRGPKRDVLMYFTPKADPVMIAFDDATLTDRMPRHQFFDLIGVHAEITALGPGGMTQQTRSQLVKVPTLVQDGERDDLIAPPTSGPPSEQAFYPLVQDFTFHVLPQIGHCYNLHLNHEESWDDIDRWLSDRE